MNGDPPPSNGKALGWLKAVQGLSFANILNLFLVALIAIPTYVIWKALGDEHLLDRLLSTYEEHPDQSGCLLRHVKERAGPDMWSISSGFAVQGVDRWFVSALISHQPTPEEVASYCETAKLLADAMRPDRSDRPVDPAR